jgi:hypothetical protein
MSEKLPVLVGNTRHSLNSSRPDDYNATIDAHKAEMRASTSSALFKSFGSTVDAAPNIPTENKAITEAIPKKLDISQISVVINLIPDAVCLLDSHGYVMVGNNEFNETIRLKNQQGGGDLFLVVY